jgi:hypothetical protein
MNEQTYEKTANYPNLEADLQALVAMLARYARSHSRSHT